MVKRSSFEVCTKYSAIITLTELTSEDYRGYMNVVRHDSDVDSVQDGNSNTITEDLVADPLDVQISDDTLLGSFQEYSGG